MLGIGLMLYCVRGLTGNLEWNNKYLKDAFWTLNIGLAAMVFISLLPVGLIQFFAVLDNGYWYTRSPEVIHSSIVETFVWIHVPGDVLFAVGGLLLGLFLLDLLKKALTSKPALEATGELTASA